MSVELFLSFDEHLDWLTLIKFGQVENAQPRDHWREVNDSFAYILRPPGGLLYIRSRRSGGIGDLEES